MISRRIMTCFCTRLCLLHVCCTVGKTTTSVYNQVWFSCDHHIYPFNWHMQQGGFFHFNCRRSVAYQSPPLCQNDKPAFLYYVLITFSWHIQEKTTFRGFLSCVNKPDFRLWLLAKVYLFPIASWKSGGNLCDLDFTGQYLTPAGEARGDVFYFDYGVVVFWGLEKHQVSTSPVWISHWHHIKFLRDGLVVSYVWLGTLCWRSESLPLMTSRGAAFWPWFHTLMFSSGASTSTGCTLVTNKLLTWVRTLLH